MHTRSLAPVKLAYVIEYKQVAGVKKYKSEERRALHFFGSTDKRNLLRGTSETDYGSFVSS